MTTDQQPTNTDTKRSRIPDEELSKELDRKIAEIEYESLEKNTEELSAKLGLPYLNLKGYPVDGKALLLLDEQSARDARVAIISRNAQLLTVAASDPSREETKSILKRLRSDDFEIKLVVASINSLIETWKRYALAIPKPDANVDTVTISQVTLENAQKEIDNLHDLKGKIAKLPVTKVLDVLIAGALKLHASDIHLEPEENNIRLRYRMDGVLMDIIEFPTDTYPKLLSRIKLHAGIKINVHEAPQDGRFNITLEDKEVEVRTSVLPGPDGESVVMRILDPSSIRQSLETLGMREDLLPQVKKLLAKTTGALFTTGPTGSGKTTTLYAFLKHINKPETKIITLEDPIEYRIDNITQTQVNESAGYTFAAGLRSIVRQDPDIILVGEIRDFETAEMAAQAALTGHSVFTTIHTNNAAGTIPRLIDLGLKPVTIAPAMNAAMAQRLVRRLCEHCKQKETIHPEDLELFKTHLAGLPKKVSIAKLDATTEIYYPGSCPACNTTGYKGRVGVYELFEMDPELERLIIKSPVSSEIEEMAKSKGMVTLLQDGLIKVTTGVTSVDEVMRVIGI